MRFQFIFTLLVLFFISCNSSKNIVENNINNEKRTIIANSDFSKSAKDAILYLKNLIENSKVQIIKIEIYNFHNGVSAKQIEIKKENIFLIINYKFIKPNGTENNKNKKILISEFITQLNKLELNADNEIVFAGNYQKIYIDDGENEKLFLTRKALGLLRIME